MRPDIRALIWYLWVDERHFTRKHMNSHPGQARGAATPLKQSLSAIIATHFDRAYLGEKNQKMDRNMLIITELKKQSRC